MMRRDLPGHGAGAGVPVRVAAGGEVIDPWAAAELEPDGGDHWLLSYVDILTLLLTLLVVLLVLNSTPEPRPQPLSPQSVSTTEPAATAVIEPIRRRPPPAIGGQALEKPVGVADALTRMEDLLPPVVEAPEAVPEPPSPAPDSPAVAGGPPAPVALADPLERLVAEYQDDRLRVRRVSQGINLEMRDSILFAPGSARLTGEGEALLAGLAGVLVAGGGLISVEGHTDDRPIATTRFPSNWELSTGRATAVARFLIGRGLDAARVRAIGYASTRPLAANDTRRGRARNRRVSLVVRLTPGPHDTGP